MIIRHLQSIIEKWLFRKKIIILYGARQVGKTTLVKSLLDNFSDSSAYFNCEIQSVREAIRATEPVLLQKLFGDHPLIVLDEAQFIPEIGRILKIIADTLPEVQVIATGSSSFELANRTSEPLTGRALTFLLYPFSYSELSQLYTPLARVAQLDHWLRYGLYPEIVQANTADARILLDDLSSRYLYRDILVFENLKNADILHKLLQMIALQLGQEVSYHELATVLQINQRTVVRYIELLEKAFVLYRLPPFSRNLRKEISKKQKIYFYDLGIRNSIIQQYQPIDLRNDKGALWENFLLTERLKYLQIQQVRPNRYFWRTHDQQEVDYIEESDGQLNAYEFKWKIKKRKVPPAFTKAYPDAQLQWIDQSNFEVFVEG